MLRTRRRAVVALVVSVLVGVAAFLAWHEGVPAYQRAQPVEPVTPSESLAVPEQVYDPSAYAPATDTWGPPGPVSLVFQGRGAREGFTGEIASPWYAVSARTGHYWRLAVPHLSEASGRLWLAPQGTKVAWVASGGVVATYDLVSGSATVHDVPGAVVSTPLVWSPRSRWVAVGTDPVHLLEPATGDVGDTSLRGASAGSPPAWTPNGRRVTVTGADAITSVGVPDSQGGQVAQQSRVPTTEAGALRSPAWSTAGVVGGTHLIDDPRHTVLRVLRVSGPGASGARVRMRDENPEGLVIDRFLGWADADHAVLTGLRPETGPIEQAMVLSLPQDTLQPYMLFPSLGDNWAGSDTVSVAADLLHEPSRAFERPTKPWSPGAKLLLCLLLAVFPTVYYLVAHRPRRR